MGLSQSLLKLLEKNLTRYRKKNGFKNWKKITHAIVVTFQPIAIGLELQLVKPYVSSLTGCQLFFHQDFFFIRIQKFGHDHRVGIIKL